MTRQTVAADTTVGQGEHHRIYVFQIADRITCGTDPAYNVTGEHYERGWSESGVFWTCIERIAGWKASCGRVLGAVKRPPLFEMRAALLLRTAAR